MTDPSDPEAVRRLRHAEFYRDIEAQLSAIRADDRGTTIVSLLDGTVVALSRKSVADNVPPVQGLRAKVQDDYLEAEWVRTQLYRWFKPESPGQYPN